MVTRVFKKLEINRDCVFFHKIISGQNFNFSCRTHRSLKRQYSINAGMNAGMDFPLEQLITSIHACPTKAVIVVTGGAVQASSWLLSVPGASNTVIEALVPYARESLSSFLGHEPEQFCSESTAIQIAKAAFQRAAALSTLSTPILGVGATCALASVPIKRGDHRAYIACHGSFGTRVTSINLAKGARNRMAEDDLVSRALIKLVAQSMDLDITAFTLPLVLEGATAAEGQQPVAISDVVHQSLIAMSDPISDLLEGKVQCVEYSPNGSVVVDAPRNQKIVLSGSFNPLHDGHKKMLNTAVEQFGAVKGLEGCFELSIGNADKGMLTAIEIRKRVRQFISAGLPVVLTSAPLFVEKAGLMRSCRFVVGYDTAVRMVMPKYYNNSFTQMLLDFSRLRECGCSFIVAGRLDSGTESFKGLSDIDVPLELADLFECIPEEVFRLDISSTELRKNLAPEAM
ncbi:hypothetical protein CEUSTIGMA_g3942.t1 [Chlamydomonas eustigma]|uniref:Uncharacterized protein n=1 Tax=Chlamydomonas eustigma TaxID=1157962 RepID=A0A250X095_9CHLO|nr:hypothetical protein CEUSTIGMA_g3942.t1 [Chlamydomonas eustigma]|eukprot:GAX76497.1 hypothetical protein CEUSTIGMA_g3942.t1 [Chlamydomonas eustigma]